MTITELRETLADLAGPVAGPTAADRHAVRGHVRRSRIVRATSAVALSLAVLVGVVVVATSWNEDQSTQVVTAGETTVHDKTFGYTVTIPAGWERETLPIQSGSKLPIILSLSYAYTEPVVSVPVDGPARQRYEALLPVHTNLMNLREQLQGLPPGARQEQVLAGRIKELEEAEARIRSLPGGECTPTGKQTGVHIGLQEGTGPTEPRPARFGPTSGTDLAQDVVSVCPRFLQMASFADQGRKFYVAITMAADTTPARRAEVYAILNSLRFDKTTTVSTGGHAPDSTTTTLG